MLNSFVEARTANVPRPLPSKEKQKENQLTTDNVAQCSVTSIYNVKIADACRNVTTIWYKSLVIHSFTVNVEHPSDYQSQYTCKIDLKTWYFWAERVSTLKSLEVNGKKGRCLLDFRQAKFSTSPEPCSEYYVALVSGEEVTLVLGDKKVDAFKRTKKRPSLEDPTMICKKEHICGKTLFCSRARLGDGKQEYDIVIENSLSGPDDPEMWVTIDGTAVARIMNLHWRFRGNEIIRVNHILPIYWDVHDWLYNNSSSSYGLFIFTLAVPEPAFDCPSEDNCSREDDGSNMNDYSQWEDQSVPRFCYVIYAWKIE